MVFRGHHLDNACEVGKQVALVVVREESGHSGRVEFNLVVVDFDEMHGRIGLDQRQKSIFNGGRYLALLPYTVSIT